MQSHIDLFKKLQERILTDYKLYFNKVLGSIIYNYSECTVNIINGEIEIKCKIFDEALVISKNIKFFGKNKIEEEDYEIFAEEGVLFGKKKIVYTMPPQTSANDLRNVLDYLCQDFYNMDLISFASQVLDEIGNKTAKQKIINKQREYIDQKKREKKLDKQRVEALKILENYGILEEIERYIKQKNYARAVETFQLARKHAKQHVPTAQKVLEFFKIAFNLNDIKVEDLYL